ncbi:MULTISPECIES: LysR family transcriptional regulator [Paraburkholderia]|uniref:LysR family transcriptional regulator n=1 Tax=Paraburkholderia TaxID=1822464 RepID=UPI0006B611C0|nr:MULTISPECIES: LysR family transcriptional regulator [Paraburkholderia]KPD14535.1 LysR family transcriptional regulator [Burkholderia sp. ST111]MBK5153689.1 LysR family transcriptional regulator [Burkholderia sp. R-69608]MBK5186494.1 LysR family transcriptional regulator [Burkholderia sp. R-69749]CAE6901198.1 HTH-type transcriptional regulator BenM [Paraburkholderia domus]CAE6966332.1 HTH-type transcriptional regulator BenM [Paraburkholderia nemoris]
MINFRLIRHLWLFLAVAEEQHFGRAARRLDMSQPPLTEQIQALEQALKVKLFERSRRGAQLTPVGVAILPAVRKFAEQLERLEFAVREAVAGRSGVLTIGAISSAMLDVLPPLLERLKFEYPHLTIAVKEIDSVEAIPALEAGDIDLAFARLEGELGGTIQSLPLAQDHLVVAMHREHAMAGISRIGLASLAEEDFVMFSRQVSPVYFDSLVASCRSNGFSPRILHEVRSVASQVAFVGCGQGIALVPASLKKLAPENVVFRPLKETVNVVTTALAWNACRDNPLITAVVAILGSTGAAAKMRKPPD